MVKAGTKGGRHGDFVLGCAGDFGISVFLRPRRQYRAEASLLNRVPDSSMQSGEQVVRGSMIDRIGFVV